MDIFFTSDTHSYLYPTSFLTRDFVNAGLDRIIDSIRLHPESQDAIFIDGGDSLQGSPLSKYVMQAGISPWPQAQAFRRLGLDIMTVGNHDFDFGHEALRDFLSQTGATVLCANAHDKKGEIPFVPHVVLTDKDGLRIGFTGLITEYAAQLGNPSVMKDFTLDGAFETAQRELTWLKSHADVSVLVYHGGFENDPRTGSPMPGSMGNCGYKMATELDFDLILSAHQHMELPFMKLGNSYVLQCLPNGAQYAKVSISKDPSCGVAITGSLLRPEAPSSADSLASGSDRLSGSDMLSGSDGLLGSDALLGSDGLLEEVQAWLDSPAGELASAVEAGTHLGAFLHGSHIADFFNTVQLEASGADISCTALSNQLCGFDRTLTLRQILAAYPYANTMVVLSVGEKELREALEVCATFLELEDGRPVIAKQYSEPFAQYYNFDLYLGLEYTFDLSRPKGSRVVRLTYKGQKIGDRRLKLVLNNYRASGNGGYQVFSSCPVVREMADNIQDVALQYLLDHKGTLAWPYSDYETTGYTIEGEMK